MMTLNSSDNDKSLNDDASQHYRTGTSLDNTDTVASLLSQKNAPETIVRKLREMTSESFINLSRQQRISQEERIIPINNIRRFFLDKPPSDLEIFLNKSEQDLTSINFTIVDIVRLIAGYIICLTGLSLVAYGIFTILSDKNSAELVVSNPISFGSFIALIVGISFVVVGIFVIKSRGIITPLLYDSIKRAIVSSITEETVVRWCNDNLRQDKKG